jgi:hypothetical protein
MPTAVDAYADPARADPAALRPGSFPMRHRLLASLFAAAAVALWLPAGFRALDVRGQLGLGALSVTLLSFAALATVTATPQGARGISRWRIGPWYLLWSALTFGIAPLTWLMPQTGSASRIPIASVLTAIVLFGMSIVPWTVGYCAGAPQAVRRFAEHGLSVLLRNTTSTIRGGTMPWVLYGMGTVARLLTVAVTGRFGYVGDPSALYSQAGALDHILKMASTFSLFAVAAAAYRAFSDTTRGSKLTLITLVSAEAMVGALAGGKQYFILSVLAVLVPYGALRGRISLRILLAGAAVFLWIAVPFNTAYRQVVRSDDSTLSPAAAVAAAPEVFSSVLAADSIAEAMTGSSIQMLQRVRMIDSVAITTHLTPDTIPYRSPAEFASAPLIGLVPRALWPDKPVLATGYEFSQQYYGTSSEMYTSAGITPLGDLYRHGGILTVAVGMLILGMGARLFDALFRPEADPRAICFVLAFLPMLLRSDIYNMVVSIPSGLVLATVGAHLLCRSPRATGTAR